MKSLDLIEPEGKIDVDPKNRYLHKSVQIYEKLNKSKK